MEFNVDHMCFACGKDNPIGLKLTFSHEGDAVTSTFVADNAYQGYEGIIHGGIIATLLDEVMVQCVWAKAGSSATAKLNLQYRNPAPTQRPILLRGWITAVRRNGRVYETAATACLDDGTMLAEATGMIIRTGNGE
ncbi:MAG TPA: PaaI family thioesterase [Armatimonadota bacterium]|nr:PaaI family thioesterase [Armatimonadota bacterium]